jgi:hypothetical protein
LFYVISPSEETSWSVDRTTLTLLLEEHWPGATVELDGRQPTREVVWQIPMPEGDLDGSQDREGQAQYLTGLPVTLARYAHWWRQQVPPAQSLVLYDEAYSTVLPLDPGVTEHELLERLV